MANGLHFHPLVASATVTKLSYFQIEAPISARAIIVEALPELGVVS
jgi:hypothetical protein